MCKSKMKKLLFSLLMALSLSAQAAPCWLTVNEYTFNADAVVFMQTINGIVRIRFGPNIFIDVDTHSQAAGRNLIADIVTKSRACK
jgi:hypothetical protein